MRMKWAQLLSSSFFFLSFFFFSFSFFSFFFAFHRFSLPINGTCYHFIDDVRVRMCAEDGLKDSFFFFFFLRLNFRLLAHDCDQDERKCDQKNGTRDNSASGTEKIFRALPGPHQRVFSTRVYTHPCIRAHWLIHGYEHLTLRSLNSCFWHFFSWLWLKLANSLLSSYISVSFLGVLAYICRVFLVPFFFFARLEFSHCHYFKPVISPSVYKPIPCISPPNHRSKHV